MPVVGRDGEPRNAALERRAVEELARLEPPRSIEAQWRLIIAYRRTLAHALTEVARAARTGNGTAVNKLGASKARVRSKLLALGKHLGFISCQQLG